LLEKSGQKDRGVMENDAGGGPKRREGKGIAENHGCPSSPVGGVGFTEGAVCNPGRRRIG